MSLVDETAEWTNRRISIIGAAKSFISQLSIGQDLTKVSLPSVFVYPYSALEIGGARSLGLFHLLQKANAEEDPVKRMLGVLAFFISQTKKEVFEKKPSNSILGEEHFCWADTENGRVYYIAEQVSHHPPISVLQLESKNENEHIKFLVNFETGGIKFHGNSVGISVRGAYRIEMLNPFTKVWEQYIADKPWPNISVRNVILGTKREPWEGDVMILCPQNKLKAVLSWKEEGWYCVNVVNGVITQEDSGKSTPLYHLYGPVSQTIMIHTEENHNAVDKQEQVLVNYETLNRNKIHYLPESQWSEKNSLRVWKDMYRGIVDNDMPAADAAKKLVEDAQRKRRNEGQNYVPQHFALNEASGIWEFKHPNVRDVFFQLGFDKEVAVESKQES